MPLLMATSTFRLGRRRWSSPQQCYLHCSCLRFGPQADCACIMFAFIVLYCIVLYTVSVPLVIIKLPKLYILLRGHFHFQSKVFIRTDFRFLASVSSNLWQAVAYRHKFLLTYLLTGTRNQKSCQVQHNQRLKSRLQPLSQRQTPFTISHCKIFKLRKPVIRQNKTSMKD